MRCILPPNGKAACYAASHIITLLWTNALLNYLPYHCDSLSVVSLVVLALAAVCLRCGRCVVSCDEAPRERELSLEEAMEVVRVEAIQVAKIQEAKNAVYRVADWCVVLPLLCMSLLAGQMLIWWIYMGIFLFAELVRCCRGLCDDTISQ
mmetsp:Transcript_12722/g.30344  ORF Transcript_12722/g.30344 Transcript_12722/m.30344 type:complete len:150 (+) Transcript_12722:420-869(+)